MKKVLLTAVLIGAMATTAMASTWYTGKIGKVNSLDTGHLVVQVLDGATDPYLYINSDTMDTHKQMVAVVLTAKASNADVQLFEVNNKWERVMLK